MKTFIVRTNDGNSYTIKAEDENQATDIVASFISFTSISGIIEL